MAIYYDQFYTLDPGNPPPLGTAVSPATLSINDRNNDGWVTPTTGGGGRYDMVDGVRVTAVWEGDTITLAKPNGVEYSITGTTFYLQDGRAVFTPIDGSILHNSTFISSTYVTQSTQMAVGDLGPECFTAGTMIATPEGEKPVEWLRIGDLVMTRDAGPQPILWTGGRQVRGYGSYAPVRFETGSLGNSRPLLVSQQHRMLVSGWRAELACGSDEVLVAAKHLVDGQSVRLTEMAHLHYVHILLDAHHILIAEGAPSESLFPGNMILEEDRRISAEIRAAWTRRSTRPIETMVTARQVARGPEIALLAA